jgi:hypothetical protein
MTRTLRVGLLVILIACGTTGPGHASPRRAFLSDWSLSVQLGGRYVDNAIRLSEADMDRFQNGAEAFETPLQTYDDWKSELILRPRVRLRLPRQHCLIALYSFKATEYTRNRFLNYYTHTLNLYLRPVSSRYRWLVNFRVFTIPSYFLRYHYDRDTRAYHAARFQNWQYRVAPRFRLWRSLLIELHGEFETTYYNAKFTEYDSEMISLGLGAEYRRFHQFTLAVDYRRNRSDNVGRRQIGSLEWSPEDPLGEDTEYGDATFDEDEFSAELSRPVDLWAAIPMRFSVQGRLRWRVYTTDNSLDEDPFHRGRLDKRWEISPSVTASLTRGVDLTLGYSHEERRTESDIERVEEIKNFRVREVYIALEHEFR